MTDNGPTGDAPPPGSSGAVFNDQYNAWIYIVGGQSPATKGGDWLKKWLEHRTEDDSNPDKSAGRW
jgi:hypothetical protein